MTYRVGVDTGGTFTDVVVTDAETGETWVHKTASTPPDFDRGVLSGIDEGIDAAGASPGSVSFLSHGTTVGTNAVLEGDLPPIGLVTNEGLEDVLAIGHQTRPSLYDLQAEKPDPPVKRRYRKGVPGRIDETGSVVEPLEEAAIREVARELASAEEDLRAVAISTLFSYLEPAHEKQIAAILGEEGLDPVRSSAVHPEVREYERTVTTALNAAVRGRVGEYLDRLSTGVAERSIPATLNVMHSGGGLFDTDTATRMAIRTVLSGPAAGAVATRVVAGREGYDDAVGMDVGGTSADVSLVRDGDLVRTTEGEVGGYPLRTPMIDVTTVGAGGGSVVRIDSGGAVRIGPESAGADPGPVCYGRGGERPTLTDANLLLGRLNPEFFLDGEMDLAVDRARDAFREQIADPLGESVAAAALAAVQVANASLARQIRRVTVERGDDPSEFALVAFGGAGPLQAATVAREVGMNAVVVPPTPGVFSARGLLQADVRVDESRSYRGSFDPDPLDVEFDRLEQTLADRFRSQGFDPAEFSVERSADLRYEGQSYELTVDVADSLDASALERAVDRFHAAHERQYGHALPEEPIEAVTLRVSGRAPTPDLDPPELDSAAGSTDPRATRTVQFTDGQRETSVYRRSDLGRGAQIDGPAIVEESGSTTLVDPAASITVTDAGSLLVDW